MKISKNRLVEIIKEELELASDPEDTVDDLVYELEYLLGRVPTPEEDERIRQADLAGDIPLRGSNE